MGNKIVSFIIFICFFLVIGIAVSNSTKQDTTDRNVIKVGYAYPDEPQIRSAIFKAGIVRKDENIRGVIVPHHLLASDLIARGVSQLDVSKIVVIGPDHYEAGGGGYFSSSLIYDTPYGIVYPEVIPGFPLNNSAAEREHSISNMMPFIARFSPKIPVVPIIVSQRISLKELEKLADMLMLDHTVYIASVDFSHYLKSMEADVNDKKTLELIKNREYENILRLGNDFIDSPQVVVLFLMIMDRLEVSNMDVLSHTNSGYLTGNFDGSTTSYFVLAFTR